MRAQDLTKGIYIYIYTYIHIFFMPSHKPIHTHTHSPFMYASSHFGLNLVWKWSEVSPNSDQIPDQIQTRFRPDFFRKSYRIGFCPKFGLNLVWIWSEVGLNLVWIWLIWGLVRKRKTHEKTNKQMTFGEQKLFTLLPPQVVFEWHKFCTTI